MSSTPNLNIDYMTDGQAGAYLVFNEALLKIDKAIYENRSIICDRQGRVMFNRITGKVILNRFNPD